jgi:phasin family protein
MTSLPEQLSAARTTQLEAQLELLRSLSTQAISSAEQVIALNLTATRTSVEQSSAAVKQLMAVRDPRDLLAFGTQTQQQFQQMMDYGRNLFSIAAGAQLELAKANLFKGTQSAAQPAPDAAAPASVAPAAAAVAASPAAASGAPAPSAAPSPVVADMAAPAASAMPAPAVAEMAAPAVAPATAESQQNDAETAAIDAIAEAARYTRPKKVVVAQEDQAAPDLGAKEKPIASAAGQMAAASAAAPHPMASPLPGNSGKIAIPKIKPVDAEPPPAPVSGTPMIESKQAEQPTPKGSRKK